MPPPRTRTRLLTMTTTPETSNVQSNPAAFSPPPFGPAEGAPTPPPPGPSYRKIRRSRDDRVIAGVAGGLGRYVNIDPVLFRILLVVLTLFGGSGILLYLFAWVAVPEDGRDDAPVNRLVARVRRRRR